MKDLKDVQHVNEIRTATMEQVQHWLTQCRQVQQMTMRELWDRESDLKDKRNN